MSFALFRKYEKPIMWATVVFSVLIFATFSSLGSLKNLLAKHSTAEIYGEFDVQSTGERHVTTTSEFMGLRQAMSRFSSGQGRSRDVRDEQVWGRLIAAEEARGLGLDVTDHDVDGFVQQIFGGQQVTREVYTYVWRDRLGFASAREMERYLHDELLVQRWLELQVQVAGLVNADDIYVRWKQDNERFDYDALVIPDLTDDEIPEPSAEDLQKLWDDTGEAIRSATYVEPRRIDVAYAWAPLGEGEHALADDKLAGLPEPSADEIQQRFDMVGEDRWPDTKTLTDEIKPAIIRELKVIAAARKASEAFAAGTEKTVEAFRKAVEDAGLAFADPEGLLGNDEITKLPDIGNETLPLWLAQQKVETVYFGYPYSAEDKDVHLVLVQAEQPSRPLSFEEAHDKLVTNWRNGRRDQPAQDFREALSKAARELPECAAAIAPLLEAANKRADAAAAALTDATDEARAAARKDVLDAAERGEIAARVAEFEHLAWDKVQRPGNARVISFAGVSKAYVRHPDGDEEPTSIERYLKVNSAVFRLGVNAISQPLRHVPSSQSAIVIVRARNAPERADMLADSAGMEAARRALGSQREAEAQNAASPVALMASHNLKVAEIAQKKHDGGPEPPPDF